MTTSKYILAFKLTAVKTFLGPEIREIKLGTIKSSFLYFILDSGEGFKSMGANF